MNTRLMNSGLQVCNSTQMGGWSWCCSSTCYVALKDCQKHENPNYFKSPLQICNSLSVQTLMSNFIFGTPFSAVCRYSWPKSSMHHSTNNFNPFRDQQQHHLKLTEENMASYIPIACTCKLD